MPILPVLGKNFSSVNDHNFLTFHISRFLSRQYPSAELRKTTEISKLSPLLIINFHPPKRGRKQPAENSTLPLPFGGSRARQNQIRIPPSNSIHRLSPPPATGGRMTTNIPARAFTSSPADDGPEIFFFFFRMTAQKRRKEQTRV